MNKKTAKLRNLIISQNEIEKVLARNYRFLRNIFELTEDGGVIFKVPLDTQSAVLAYLIAKWCIWVINSKVSPSATYDELQRVPASPARNLDDILERLKHPSEGILVTSEKGYLVSPRKIEAALKNIEDYLISTGRFTETES